LSKQGQPKTLKNNPQASGTGTDFLASQGRVLVHEYPLGKSRARKAVKNNSYKLQVARNQEKFVLMSYARELHFSGSSTKRRVPPSRN
jgi:hypothetical protein